MSYPKKKVGMNLDRPEKGSQGKGWDEPKQPYKQVPREKVGINLLKYTRIIPRWCARMFQRKNLGTSLDKNAMMSQEKSNMRFSEGILTMYLYKNTNLSMFLYAARTP